MAKIRHRRKDRPAAHQVSEAGYFASFLGPLAQGYSKGQLHVLQQEMVGMAELLLDFYLIRSRGKGFEAGQNLAAVDKEAGESNI